MDPLLRQARAGADAAWQHLITAHDTLLRRFLLRRMGARLRRSCSVSDLVQEVFTRMFVALRSLPEDATLRTFRRWVLQHANWVLADHGHLAQRHFGESAAVAAAELAPAPRPAQTTGAVTRSDQLGWLHALLERLDQRHADVVRLRLEGLSFAAIAERLHLEEAAVRQRYSRVVRTLAELHGGTRTVE
jgi:RNA polymerase sigma factor (sigma-70 family)